jgi:hypothetical protein
MLRQWTAFSSGKIVLRQQQWSIKCKNGVVRLRQIIPVADQKCQVEIFLFEVFDQVLYNIYID